MGFNIRRYRNGKLMITPSQAAGKRVKRKLAGEDAPPARRTNRRPRRDLPDHAGWRAYTGSWCPRKKFNDVDDYFVEAHLQVGLPQPPRKPKHWSPDAVFGRFKPLRKQQWVSATPQRRLPPGWPGPQSSGTERSQAGLTRRPRPDEYWLLLGGGGGLWETSGRPRTSSA